MRPFGTSVLLAGEGRLFQLDPSGVSHEWKATAVGRHAEQVKKVLERRYRPGLDLDEAVHIGLSALKERFEGVMSGRNVEVLNVGSAVVRLSAEQVQSAVDFLRE